MNHIIKHYAWRQFHSQEIKNTITCGSDTTVRFLNISDMHISAEAIKQLNMSFKTNKPRSRVMKLYLHGEDIP